MPNTSLGLPRALPLIARPPRPAVTDVGKSPNMSVFPLFQLQRVNRPISSVTDFYKFDGVAVFDPTLARGNDNTSLISRSSGLAWTKSAPLRGSKQNSHCRPSHPGAAYQGEK